MTEEQKTTAAIIAGPVLTALFTIGVMSILTDLMTQSFVIGKLKAPSSSGNLSNTLDRLTYRMVEVNHYIAIITVAILILLACGFVIATCCAAYRFVRSKL